LGIIFLSLISVYILIRKSITFYVVYLYILRLGTFICSFNLSIYTSNLRPILQKLEFQKFKLFKNYKTWFIRRYKIEYIYIYSSSSKYVSWQRVNVIQSLLEYKWFRSFILMSRKCTLSCPVYCLHDAECAILIIFLELLTNLLAVEIYWGEGPPLWLLRSKLIRRLVQKHSLPQLLNTWTVK
jgi:hypothetical protein